MTPPAVVDVQAFAPEDWQAYREIRLAMLLESPWAFGSSHASALALDEGTWRQRLAENRTFLARVDGAAAGAATYFDTFAEASDEAELIGMWVDPLFRGTGAAVELVTAVLDEARRRGKRRVLLWVVDNNPRARRFYQRCGFVATGDTMPYPHDERVTELRLERVL